MRVGGLPWPPTITTNLYDLTWQYDLVPSDLVKNNPGAAQLPPGSNLTNPPCYNPGNSVNVEYFGSDVAFGMVRRRAEASWLLVEGDGGQQGLQRWDWPHGWGRTVPCSGWQHACKPRPQQVAGPWRCATGSHTQPALPHLPFCPAVCWRQSGGRRGGAGGCNGSRPSRWLPAQPVSEWVGWGGVPVVRWLHHASCSALRWGQGLSQAPPASCNPFTRLHHLYLSAPQAGLTSLAPTQDRWHLAALGLWSRCIGLWTC